MRPITTLLGTAVLASAIALAAPAQAQAATALPRTTPACGAVEAYRADAFPNRAVYGNSARPELRLITCGGGFDRKRQEHLGNVVAYAHLTATRR